MKGQYPDLSTILHLVGGGGDWRILTERPTGDFPRVDAYSDRVEHYATTTAGDYLARVHPARKRAEITAFLATRAGDAHWGNPSAATAAERAERAVCEALSLDELEMRFMAALER